MAVYGPLIGLCAQTYTASLASGVRAYRQYFRVGRAGTGWYRRMESRKSGISRRMALVSPGQSAYRVIWIQLLVAAVVAGAASVHGTVVMVSAVAGAMNSLIPNAYFARKVLGRTTDEPPGMVLGRWFRAEVGKLAMIAGLFIVAFAFIDKLNVVALFSGFLCVHVSGVVASFTVDPYGGDQP